MLPRLATVLLLPLAASACAGLGTGPDPAAGGPPFLAERSLLLLIADRREYEPFTVEKALGGPVELRRDLAVALGRSGHRDGRAVLEGLMIDDAPAVREAALFALGVARHEAAPTLLVRAGEASRAEGMLAVEALGKIGAPLVDVLTALTPLPEEERWARLLPSLWRFPGPAASRVAMLGYRQGSRELRPLAILALARQAASPSTESPAPEILAVLVAALADEDPRARAWAAQAWVRSGGPTPLAALAPLLDDAEVLPVVAALSAGAVLAPEEEPAVAGLWRRRLLERLGDPRSGVRLAALAAAWRWFSEAGMQEAGLPGAALAGELAERFASGPPRERELALLALAAGQRPEALPALALAGRSPSWRLRRAAAEAAGRLGLIAPLPELSRDPTPAVREAALVARLDRPGAETKSLLADGLGDEDPGVRAGVLRWLAGHPVLPYEALEASLQLAERDFVPAPRLTAISALAARAAAEPLERGSVVRVLERLAEGRDHLARREVLAALSRLGRSVPPPDGIETGRGSDIYRDVLQRTAASHRVRLRLAKGAVEIEIACPEAPLTCLSFLQLAGQGFFDGLDFFRVEPGRSVATGDPRGDGWGGPGYTLRDEITRLPARRGAVAMLAPGPDQAGSQLQILLSDQPELDGEITVFGRVVSGMELLDAVEEGETVESVSEVERLR